MSEFLMAEFLASLNKQAKREYLEISRDWPKARDEDEEEERYSAFLSGYFHGIQACANKNGRVTVNIKREGRG